MTLYTHVFKFDGTVVVDDIGPLLTVHVCLCVYAAVCAWPVSRLVRCATVVSVSARPRGILSWLATLKQKEHNTYKR